MWFWDDSLLLQADRGTLGLLFFEADSALTNTDPGNLQALLDAGQVDRPAHVRTGDTRNLLHLPSLGVCGLDIEPSEVGLPPTFPTAHQTRGPLP